ncbi:hypothetical protein AA313_de0205565 [Arthrobotrys entomopaga]|nr:hypothetical protein AA313_de0205565 [Arthrobotrys entomopaga]
MAAQRGRSTSVCHVSEASSPLSSPPASPIAPKRSASPTSDALQDTDATKRLSNLGLSSSNDTPPPKKRSKLTAEEKAEKEKEKIEKKREKEEKDKEKARIKAEKEEQKKLKDEEKAKKEAEKAADKVKRDEEKAKREEEKARREEDKAKREEEKARKDAEKAKKEEAKAKKDRAQLRMDAFFSRKDSSVASTSRSTPSEGTPKKAAAAPTLPSNDIQAPVKGQPKLTALSTITISSAPEVEMSDIPHKSEFDKYFESFYVKPRVLVAPPHSFQKDDAASEYICKEMDKLICQHESQPDDAMDIDKGEFSIPQPLPPSYFEEVFVLPPAKRQKRGNLPKFTTKQILVGLNSSPGPIANAFSEERIDQRDYIAILKKLPRKNLRFAEDVRPGYRGTFTRVPESSGLRKGRNPFQKSLPGVDYDYDSEAEWVEGPDDDGEELKSEMDEEEDIDTADEMDDFLDDETEDLAKKGHKLSGPLIPVSTGIVWQYEQAKSNVDMSQFKINLLIADDGAPIDPFSDSYWQSSSDQTIFRNPQQPLSTSTLHFSTDTRTENGQRYFNSLPSTQNPPHGKGVAQMNISPHRPLPMFGSQELGSSSVSNQQSGSKPILDPKYPAPTLNLSDPNLGPTCLPPILDPRCLPPPGTRGLMKDVITKLPDGAHGLKGWCGIPLDQRKAFIGPLFVQPRAQPQAQPFYSPIANTNQRPSVQNGPGVSQFHGSYHQTNPPRAEPAIAGPSTQMPRTATFPPPRHQMPAFGPPPPQMPAQLSGLQKSALWSKANRGPEDLFVYSETQHISYAAFIKSPEAVQALGDTVPNLGTLADSKYAATINLPADEHFGFFKILHGLDCCQIETMEKLDDFLDEILDTVKPWPKNVIVNVLTRR